MYQFWLIKHSGRTIKCTNSGHNNHVHNMVDSPQGDGLFYPGFMEVRSNFFIPQYFLHGALAEVEAAAARTLRKHLLGASSQVLLHAFFNGSCLSQSKTNTHQGKQYCMGGGWWLWAIKNSNPHSSNKNSHQSIW